MSSPRERRLAVRGHSKVVRHRHQVPAPLYCRDGCHHCGRRAGKAIADHIPPNVVAYGQGYRTRLQVERPLASPGPKTKRAVSQALKLMGDALPSFPAAAGCVRHRQCLDSNPYLTIAHSPLLFFAARARSTTSLPASLSASSLAVGC